MDSVASFGQWVRLRRTSLHLTQGELARRVYCSEITIRKIEGDERRPSPEIARGLAEHLQLPADLAPRFLKVARGDLSVDHLPLLQADVERPRHWLPVLSRADLAMPNTSFLGRTQEVAQICDLLQQPDVRLLTLVGPPGIGKSRLSLHVTAELGDAFLNGAQFVPLAPLRDHALVPDAVAQLFGFAESGFATPLDYLRVELRQRHLLLVLDNFEQVLAARDFVQELLAVAPQVKMLVTSRVALGLSGEQVYTVPGLSMPVTAHAPSALAAIRFPAVQLLVSRARSANPAFALTTENAGDIVAICARVDGLPLAIELVAARLKTLTPDALLARLTDWLALPVDGADKLPERHRTLRSAIAWSYELLPPAAQRVFARLGVFVHGATVDLAQAVCGDVDEPTGNVQTQIETLVSHNLVRAEDDGVGGVRYTMLETVLDYARDRLAARGEQELIRLRHAETLCLFAETAAPHLHGLERRAWLERVEAENDNLRAALDWAEAQSDAALLARLVAALGWFWEMNGRRVEARTWLDAALATPAATQPPHARARILQMVGHIAGEEGDLELSRRYAEASLALAASLDDGWTVALARRDLGWVVFAADNECEAAIALAEQAAAGLLAAGDLRNYLLALLDAGGICQLTGDAQRGLPYAERALRLAREWNDEPSAEEALAVLGMLEYTAGNLDAAQTAMSAVLATAQRLPNGKQLAWAYYKMGLIMLTVGDAQEGAAFYTESARLWADRKETLAVAYCESGIANCYFDQGLFAQARALYQATLDVFRRFDVQRAVAWSLWNVAHAAAAEGDDDCVASALQESLAIFQARRDEQGIASCMAALRGTWGPAREPFRQ
ncbi:MAG: helix-turn-helix domain-containing protein [Caldilinea sp.]|nr:helix-turn-helix domain-containing protein [Caldilinea sp.]MCB9116252.1 helix-turn-helix domain-containing protein [Caldilineaceae bacterium]MCB9122592.1 helix-turn-helix domain-containing protein [Caldilineaceae bacterium]MCB9123797.1 helix-turn-helix domain-containing protein [Caldilineaceae bacterium]MCO5208121.1 helix-turn-helix domain-containing protein [Caldilinea sp.]